MKKEFEFLCPTVEDTQHLAQILGASLKGGEVLEFTSDLGGGKTTFVKGLAKGMGITEVVQSPTFTISFIHKAPNNLELHHFDFYRLQDAGVMAEELSESIHQPGAVVAIEWSDIVHDILPEDKISVDIAVDPSDEGRKIILKIPDEYKQLVKVLQDYKK